MEYCEVTMENCDDTKEHCDSKALHSDVTIQHCSVKTQHFDGAVERCDVAGTIMMTALPTAVSIFALDIYDSLAILLKFRVKCQLLWESSLVLIV